MTIWWSAVVCAGVGPVEPLVAVILVTTIWLVGLAWAESEHVFNMHTQMGEDLPVGSQYLVRRGGGHLQ